MAALTNPPEPVSVLIEYGLDEELSAKLVEAGVGTIEKLGGMTPEQLEEIPGIDPEMVENIRDSVTNYYGQFEEAAPAAPEEGEVPIEAEAAAEAAAEEPDPSTQHLAEQPAVSAPPVGAGSAAETEPGTQDPEPSPESDTIKDSGPVSHDESDNRGSLNE